MTALPGKAPTPFCTANPHALATILEASETKQIIAARDIFDVSGIKLWARDQPVSQALQRKLLDRQLRNPLESCLVAENGVRPQTLLQALQALLDGAHALAAVLRPFAAPLCRQAPQLPLHPVAQLLLTAAQATRPPAFEHAVQAMALAGALRAAQGASVAELRLAMLGGLLHDLGEIYIDPRYGEADADRTLDFVSYQQLVVHPHIGRLLLTQLTDYPISLACAVAEHHERLDGSGYPHGHGRDALSPLGRLLALTEAALGALRRCAGAPDALARISVALRVVPGEFDLTPMGPISDALRALPAAGAAATPPAQLQARLQRLDAALQQAQQTAQQLAAAAEPAPLAQALALAQHLLARLRAGWCASGLWAVHAPGGAETAEATEAAEAAAVEEELLLRLRAIERAVLLRAGRLSGAAAERLQTLCAALRVAAP